MLVGALLTVFAMLHHPEGVAQNPTYKNVAKWVHGSLIFFLIFNTYGLIRFSNTHAIKGLDIKLGLLFYYVGIGAFIVAALVSGFIQTSLASAYGENAEAISNFNKFASLFNQALAKLGVVSFGATGVFFAPVLIIEKGAPRLVGIIGGIVGVALLTSMLSGFYLSVMTMTILTILIVIWHATIAVFLFNK